MAFWPRYEREIDGAAMPWGMQAATNTCQARLHTMDRIIEVRTWLLRRV